MSSNSKRRVCYFYDEEVGNFYYSMGHPMKPHRVRMAHELVLSYGLYKKMQIFRPHLLSEEEMTRFHADDYIDFLRHVTPDNVEDYGVEMQRYNIGVDCPVFDGLFKFCQMYSGGSVGAAYKLNRGDADIAINWSGGLHHAKRSEASGFCYVNDIVLSILELLRYHQRVVYIDIDIHHGDGVEEAFYTTDRVMTISFHKYGEYFPGTGGVKDTGMDQGKNYSLNFPLRDGIDDASFESIFKTVLSRVMERYSPGAVVLQCGADSLAGDRLGCFNLSLKGHGACVSFMRSFNVPLLVLGGGGYTVRNVSRCWAHETALLLDTPMPDEIPNNAFYEYYAPDFNLSITPSNMEDQNTRSYLDNITAYLCQVLKGVSPRPSVQYSKEVHRIELDDSYDMDDASDETLTQRREDARVDDPREFFESEKDQDKTASSKPAPASSKA